LDMLLHQPRYRSSVRLYRLHMLLHQPRYRSSVRLYRLHMLLYEFDGFGHVLCRYFDAKLSSVNAGYIPSHTGVRVRLQNLRRAIVKVGQGDFAALHFR